MKIIHVVPSISEEASGPTYSVSALNKAMRSAGEHSRLIATGPESLGDDVRIFPRQSFPYRLGVAPEMLRWLVAEVNAQNADVLHSHGMWMMPNVYPSWAARRGKVALVISPRGTFSEWAMKQSRVRKFIMWRAVQKSAIGNADLFHATSESEYADIRRMGFRQPVAVIPNGVDLPNQEKRKFRKSNDRCLLFLSRIHPTKGLEFLLHAWSGLQQQYPEWRMRIIGPGDDAYLRDLTRLASVLELERVIFSGPLYGDEKQEAYRNADLFVLPTRSENFGMAVAEALASGCPVITTKGAPWSGLVAERAGWWIDIGTAPLKAALSEAMSADLCTLANMGARGRDWMERDFSWRRIAAQMLEAYRWANKGGTPPPWAYCD
jgi:glycosyltransferase involved in cell wall biosynthesis